MILTLRALNYLEFLRVLVCFFVFKKVFEERRKTTLVSSPKDKFILLRCSKVFKYKKTQQTCFYSQSPSHCQLSALGAGALASRRPTRQRSTWKPPVMLFFLPRYFLDSASFARFCLVFEGNWIPIGFQEEPLFPQPPCNFLLRSPSF